MATVRLPRGVVAVSEEVGGYVRRARRDVVVVENGIAPVALHPDPRRVLGLEPGALVVGGIGRLHEQKGWDVLADAAPELAARVPGVVLAIVGEGRDRAAIEARPGARHLRLLGYHEDASTLVGAFDVLVVPSRYEAFGLVAVEAMLARVPVVAAAAGGLVDVVGDSGLLVPPEDPAALVDALVRVATDPGLRAELGQRGHERAVARFGVARMARETAAAWDAVLAGRRSRAAR
jgi:glycosyltransferase involved in cell wall biosynthesis